MSRHALFPFCLKPRPSTSDIDSCCHGDWSAWQDDRGAARHQRRNFTLLDPVLYDNSSASAGPGTVENLAALYTTRQSVPLAKR